MPKRLDLRSQTPMSVYDATRAFGSELRVALLHHFARTPGRQADAAAALGVDRAVVTLNVGALVDLGVLIAEPSPTNPRSKTYHVDRDRFDELLGALRDYTRPRGPRPRRSSVGDDNDDR